MNQRRNFDLGGSKQLDVHNAIRDKLLDIIHLFVMRDYEALAEKYLIDERDIGDFVRALNEYWEFWNQEGIATMPPKEEFLSIDIIEVRKPIKAVREFSLLFDLWKMVKKVI